jgi:hypothetical protein
MRKLVSIIAISIALVSCSKNYEQEEIVKKSLSKSNLYKNEVESIEYETSEILDKDAYNYIIKRYQKQQEGYANLETSNLISKYIDSVGKSKGEKFFRVHFFRVSQDTLNNGYVLLNNKNKIIGFDYRK